jgi:hypothetical protein
MALGTTETISSIALAMVPPGNIVRIISELRLSFWTIMGESSARAYFDYPVLAWLAQPMDGSMLARLASRLDLPFELTNFGMTGADVFLRLGADTAQAVAELAGQVPLANEATEWLPGPFPAGIGVYCATVAPTITLPDSITAALDGQAIRARTYVLAQIELCWGPDQSLQSSWATLSSARSRLHRR